MKKKDLKNQIFGKLKVIEESELKLCNRVTWVCKCECGKVTNVMSNDLVSGNTSSCGCGSSRNTIGERTRTHGMRRTRQYNIWTLMLARCNKPQNISYKNYGARGVKVLWRSFEEFWNDMKDTYNDDLTIDRIDSKGNYCKENCRWVTRAEQNRNKKSNIFVEYKNEILPLKTMCLKYDFKYGTIFYRMSYMGLTFLDAINYKR